MIEKLLLAYLNEHLDVSVYLEEPEQKDDSYVIIEKTGSGKENHLCTAMIAVQSIGASMSAVIDLNEQIKKVLDDMNIPEVCSIHLNSDYNFTDSETNRYRYQAVFDVTHYE